MSEAIVGFWVKRLASGPRNARIVGLDFLMTGKQWISNRLPEIALA
jgi:hypothetical protein